MKFIDIQLWWRDFLFQEELGPKEQLVHQEARGQQEWKVLLGMMEIMVGKHNITATCEVYIQM